MGQKYAIFDKKGLPTAFYDADIHNVIPQGAIQITDDQWREFINNQGKRAFVNGQVIDITNKVWDEQRQIWRDKTEQEFLNEKKQILFNSLIAYASSYLGRSDFVIIKQIEGVSLTDHDKQLLEDRKSFRKWLAKTKRAIQNATTIEELEKIKIEFVE